MRIGQPIHRVNIVYRPEAGETQSTEECLSFSSEATARAFADRQRKLPQVISAKYISMEEHKK